MKNKKLNFRKHNIMRLDYNFLIFYFLFHFTKPLSTRTIPNNPTRLSPNKPKGGECGIAFVACAPQAYGSLL